MASLSVLLLGGVALCGIVYGQMATSTTSKANVSRVGARIACQCGCKDTVATCSMLACSFSSPAKKKIAEMAAAGSTDQQIIDDFIQRYGAGIYRSAPNATGWIVPYVALVFGTMMIVLIIRKARRSAPRPAVATGPSDERLSRYDDQIEQELEKLEKLD